MFLNGADGENPELRSASFKGVMRFWWRAMHGNLDLDELRKMEGRIFGSVDEPAQKSRVGVRILNRKIVECKYRPLPHSETKTFQNFSIAPGYSFRLALVERGSSDSIGLDIENFFLLVSILGGFGKRSRRGFGSIQVIKINDQKPFETSLDSINRLLSAVNRAGGYAVNPGENAIESGFTSTNQFPYIEKIAIGSPCVKMDDLLIKIGNASHNNDCYYTGFQEGKNRFASPIYVSIIKQNNAYRPVVTTLHHQFDPSYDPVTSPYGNSMKKMNKADTFVREVLA
jgi:CRISPR-associated protein Cmr1